MLLALFERTRKEFPKLDLYFVDGNGILLDYNVGRFVADAEAIYSYEGTREMNTLIVGKSITGLSAFV